MNTSVATVIARFASAFAAAVISMAMSRACAGDAAPPAACEWKFIEENPLPGCYNIKECVWGATCDSSAKKKITLKKDATCPTSPPENAVPGSITNALNLRPRFFAMDYDVNSPVRSSSCSSCAKNVDLAAQADDLPSFYLQRVFWPDTSYFLSHITYLGLPLK